MVALGVRDLPRNASWLMAKALNPGGHDAGETKASNGQHDGSSNGVGRSLADSVRSAGASIKDALPATGSSVELRLDRARSATESAREAEKQALASAEEARVKVDLAKQVDEDERSHLKRDPPGAFAQRSKVGSPRRSRAADEQVEAEACAAEQEAERKFAEGARGGREAGLRGPCRGRAGEGAAPSETWLRPPNSSPRRVAWLTRRPPPPRRPRKPPTRKRSGCRRARRTAHKSATKSSRRRSDCSKQTRRPPRPWRERSPRRRETPRERRTGNRPHPVHASVAHAHDLTRLSKQELVSWHKPRTSEAVRRCPRRTWSRLYEQRSKADEMKNPFHRKIGTREDRVAGRARR